MTTYKRHRFPPDIISYAVWLYCRFNLSHWDIEDLLAERGITVSREAIRPWCIKFGAIYTRRLKRRHQGYGDTFFINPMRRLELESGGCVVRHPGGLNQLGRHRDSWVPMLLSVTCSIWEGIW